MSSCERIQAHLNDFLDGTLAAGQAQEVNAHLRVCAVCRGEYHALKTTQEQVRVMSAPSGAEAKARVLARFRQEVAARTPQPSRATNWRARLMPLSLAGAASAALLLLGTAGRWQGFSESDARTASPERTQIATAACRDALPSSGDLDQMTSVHAVQSFTVLNGNEELQQDALADANSRLNANTGGAR